MCKMKTGRKEGRKECKKKCMYCPVNAKRAITKMGDHRRERKKKKERNIKEKGIESENESEERIELARKEA